MVSFITRPTGNLVSIEDGGRVMSLGLAVSYLMLCRASGLWTYADGKVHPEIYLTRERARRFRAKEYMLSSVSMLR